MTSVRSAPPGALLGLLGPTQTDVRSSRMEGVWICLVKEISFVAVMVRTLARIAAFGGLLALLIWLTWVMLDLKHLQSGFTLP